MSEVADEAEDPHGATRGTFHGEVAVRVDVVSVHVTSSHCEASTCGPVKLAASPQCDHCLLYPSPSPRDRTRSRMPSSA